MIIEMNGKERKLTFGIGFVRKLDEIYRAEVEGIEFGVGVSVANMYLGQRNVSELSKIILCAIPRGSTLNSVDSFVEECAETEDGLESLFEEVQYEMGKSSVVKVSMKKQEKAMKEIEE